MQQLGFLRNELALRPGRIAYVLRITILTVLVVILSEVFQIPEPAYSAYIVFFISKEEKSSTLLLGIVVAVAITLSVFTTLAIYAISAGEPALRLPLMAIIVFIGMFISRASPLGQAAFVIGFLVTILLTLIDIIPPVTPIPATEILTKAVLWFWVVAMLPVSLVILGNILTGREPMDLFNQGLSERFDWAGQQLIVRPGQQGKQTSRAENVWTNLRNLLSYLKLAGLFHKNKTQEIEANKRLLAQSERLITWVDEWKKLSVTDSYLLDASSVCGTRLLSLASSMSQDTLISPQWENPVILPERDGTITNTKASLLLAKIAALVDSFPGLLNKRAETLTHKPPPTKSKQQPLRQLLVADAFSNPEYARYALKATLAIFITYVTYNLLDWPEIRTCMITCFFVSLGSVGETMHKMALRISGAIIGGMLGLATIVFIMPWLTTIMGLSLVIAIFSFFAAWVATSSERLSYAGLQIAFAFWVCILVDYGPAINLSLARDRVIGILFGNLVVFIVFSNVWPVSVMAEAKRYFSTAVKQLSRMFSMTSAHYDQDSTEEDALLLDLDEALSSAKRLIFFDPFEPMPIQAGSMVVNARLVAAVQALVAPALILRDRISSKPLPDNLRSSVTQYHTALSSWFTELETQVMNHPTKVSVAPDVNALVHDLEYASMESPIFAEGMVYADWYRTLNRRVHDLGELVQQAMASDSIMLNQERGEAR